MLFLYGFAFASSSVESAPGNIVLLPHFRLSSLVGSSGCSTPFHAARREFETSEGGSFLFRPSGFSILFLSISVFVGKTYLLNDDLCVAGAPIEGIDSIDWE